LPFRAATVTHRMPHYIFPEKFDMKSSLPLSVACYGAEALRRNFASTNDSLLDSSSPNRTDPNTDATVFVRRLYTVLFRDAPGFGAKSSLPPHWRVGFSVAFYGAEALRRKFASTIDSLLDSSPNRDRPQHLLCAGLVCGIPSLTVGAP
jgi:hypothetical protein